MAFSSFLYGFGPFHATNPIRLPLILYEFLLPYRQNFPYFTCIFPPIPFINGKKYFFDDEGRMMSGWLTDDGNIYYLGEENEGWAYTGWQYLEPDEDLG